jgi:hypothetical protein
LGLSAASGRLPQTGLPLFGYFLLAAFLTLNSGRYHRQQVQLRLQFPQPLRRRRRKRGGKTFHQRVVTSATLILMDVTFLNLKPVLGFKPEYLPKNSEAMQFFFQFNATNT